MKIGNKIQGLAVIPLTGIVLFAGTPMASAAECSLLSPCAPTSLNVAVNLPSDTLGGATVQVTTPPVEPVTTPITQAVEGVTDPVADSITNVTSPIVGNVPAPVAPIIQEPITVPPNEPSSPLEQPVASVAPVPMAAVNDNAEIVTPEDTKSVVAPVSAQVHDSAADMGGLNGITTLAPNVLDFGPAAVHSSQGEQTKVRVSGGFGFGHINPVDDPAGFASLAFAYIIVLGSAMSLAVKRGLIPNFRNLVSRI